jgi:hypothetical protein
MSDSSAYDEWLNVSDGVRVVKVEAETHEPLGQGLLADPLSALLDLGVLEHEPDRNWRVQLQLVNADIPSGPLPLPGEIPTPEDPDWYWVIRKHKALILIFELLDLAIVVVYRYDTDRTTALEMIAQSLAARQSQA